MEAFKRETLEYNLGWTCWFETSDMDAFDEAQWKRWLEAKEEGMHLMICGKYREHGSLRWSWCVDEDGVEVSQGWTDVQVS